MVSVIIPTYNRQDKIVKSINSVLAQTYADFELLIIDDGSTDNTQEVVEAIPDDRVKYVWLPHNMGAAGARNEGVKLAKGELIAFHDSDDVWHSEKLELQVRHMEAHPEFSMVFCAYMYHKGGVCCRAPLETLKIYEGDMLSQLLVKNLIGTPTMLIRKDCFWDVGGFNTALKCLEDWEFALRFAESYYIGYVDEALVDAYYTEGSVSAQALKYCEIRCYLIAEYKGYLIKYNLFEEAVSDLFAEAAKVGILDGVKSMLEAFLLASEGMGE